MKQEIPPGAHITLEPLREGPDALETRDVPQLLKATLTGLETQSTNEAEGITARKARDLFATTHPNGGLIPPSTAITEATFELLISGADRPHRACLRPPHTIILEVPTDAPIFFQWIDIRQFRVAAAILIAIFTTLAPTQNDGDNDEDDVSSDRWSFSA